MMGGVIVKTAVCSFCHRPVTETEWLVSSPYDNSVTICAGCASEAIEIVVKARREDAGQDQGGGE